MYPGLSACLSVVCHPGQSSTLRAWTVIVTRRKHGHTPVTGRRLWQNYCSFHVWLVHPEPQGHIWLEYSIYLFGHTSSCQSPGPRAQMKITTGSGASSSVQQQLVEVPHWRNAHLSASLWTNKRETERPLHCSVRPTCGIISSRIVV